jgi:hypothetical protein
VEYAPLTVPSALTSAGMPGWGNPLTILTV